MLEGFAFELWNLFFSRNVTKIIITIINPGTEYIKWWMSCNISYLHFTVFILLLQFHVKCDHVQLKCILLLTTRYGLYLRLILQISPPPPLFPKNSVCNFLRGSKLTIIQRQTMHVPIFIWDSFLFAWGKIFLIPDSPLFFRKPPKHKKKILSPLHG